jgi:hypothetical protein
VQRSLSVRVDVRCHIKYDPFGRRIYKSSSSSTSIFAYDECNLIEEANASGAAVVSCPLAPRTGSYDTKTS